MILLFSALALAQDPVVLQPGETYKAPAKVFVLPAPMFDTCLAKARALDATEEALAEAEHELKVEHETATAALEKCGVAAASAQQEALLLKKDLKIVRQQRTFLILGSAALTAIIVGETYALVEMAR